MGRIFWNKKNILMTGYSHERQTVNKWCQLEEAMLKEKQGKLQKAVHILQDDTLIQRAGKTKDGSKNLGLDYIDHPPYSLHFAPSISCFQLLKWV